MAHAGADRGDALIAEVGGDAHRVGVLDQEGGDRWPALQVERVVGQDRADPRLVEQPGRGIHDVVALDGRLVPVVEVAHVV